MALTLTDVGAAAIAGDLFVQSTGTAMALHFGSGNYDPATRAGTIAVGDDVMTDLAGSPTLTGARSDSGATVQWSFQDSDLPRNYDYAEVVFVATVGGTSTPVYLDSAPGAGDTLGSKAANTIRQWVLQVAIATGAITVYESRISVPAATEATPGVTRYSTDAEATARSAVDAAVKPDQLPAAFDPASLLAALNALTARVAILEGQATALEGRTELVVYTTQAAYDGRDQTDSTKVYLLAIT